MAQSLLSGRRLYLRYLEDADAAGPYPDWLNDPDVCRGNSHHVFPFSDAAALAYIRASREREDALILAIVLLDGDRHIGNVALEGISLIHRTAELAILIGDRSVWGQGYATEAAALLCEYGFRSLGLRRIGCGTFEDNKAMRQLALALGMREEGRRRSAAYKDGRHVDVIEYGVLWEEFRMGQGTSTLAATR